MNTDLLGNLLEIGDTIIVRDYYPLFCSTITTILDISPNNPFNVLIDIPNSPEGCNWINSLDCVNIEHTSNILTSLHGILL